MLVHELEQLEISYISKMKEKGIPASDLGQYQHEVAELHLGYVEFQLGLVESKEGPQLQLGQPTDKNSLEAKVPWGEAAATACVTSNITHFLRTDAHLHMLAEIDGGENIVYGGRENRWSGEQHVWIIGLSGECDG
jgi:hypothetical protein